MEALVTAAIVALVGSHILMMVRQERHDGEIHRLFEHNKLKRK